MHVNTLPECKAALWSIFLVNLEKRESEEKIKIESKKNPKIR